MISPEQLAASGTEHGHQAALFAYFALAENQIRWPEVKWMFAVPNGGQRSAISGARLKAEGVKPGVPDIIFPLRRYPFSGLVLEMKKPVMKKIKNGGVSDEQIAYIGFLISQEFKCEICYSWEEARDVIIKYYDLGM